MQVYKPFLLFLCIFSIFHLSSKKLNAQQMTVDDAEVTTARSIQIESWYGTYESWILPAVGISDFLEVACGVLLNSKDNFAPTNFMLEAKAVSHDLEENLSAVSVVAAYVANMDIETDAIYAYLAYSSYLLNENAVLHLNAGWEMITDVEKATNHALIYGVRADWGLSDRFSLLTEIYTENLDIPYFNGGFRISLITDLLEMDITYGRGIDSRMDEPGLGIGLAYTPDSFW